MTHAAEPHSLLWSKAQYYLKDRTVEVNRTLATLDGTPLRHGYKITMRFTREDNISPLAAPGAMVRVDILPGNPAA